MTAVINLNILNFFRLKEDNSTVNNIRFNTVSLERYDRESPPEGRVIDVTPFSRTSPDDAEQEFDARSRYLLDYRRKAAAGQITPVGTSYTRQGHVQYGDSSKGMHIDIYV